MPLREQSRIKADTVAKVCTCPGPAGTPHDAKCPSLQPDRAAKEAPPRALMFTAESEARLATEVEEERRRYPEPAWCKEFDARHAIPAPAPEPSAQAVGVPVCKGGRGKCGTRVLGYKWGFELEGLWFCSQECRTAHIKATPIPDPAPEPSAPPAGVPVCQRCGQPMEAHRFYCDMSRTVECPPPSDTVTVAPDCVDDDEIPTAEDGAETCKRLGIDVPAWAADIRARIAAVATGGVPAGYRLGDGWRLAPPETFYCGPCAGTFSRQTWAMFVGGLHDLQSCVACALSVGALVPVDTARPVPPGPVPVDAHADDCVVCQTTGHIAQPAAPASEPAVRPLSERMRPGTAPPSVVARWRDNVAALEAELDARTAQVDSVRVTLTDERDAARAEVEQLRAKLTAARSSTGDYSGEDWMAERLAAVGRSWTDAVKREREKLDASHAEVEYLRAQLVEEQKRRGAIYDATSAARMHMDSEVAPGAVTPAKGTP